VKTARGKKQTNSMTEMEEASPGPGRRLSALIGHILPGRTDVRGHNTPKISKQDDLEFPDFLRVENRTPLTSEQRARLDAVMAAARAPPQACEDLRALQLATRKEKSRVRIEKLLARRTGAAARMPLSGRAALIAINQTKNLPVRAKTAATRPAANGKARSARITPTSMATT
jgi:hypothetical protein